jgi:hypothetical protein
MAWEYAEVGEGLGGVRPGTEPKILYYLDCGPDLIRIGPKFYSFLA